MPATEPAAETASNVSQEAQRLAFARDLIREATEAAEAIVDEEARQFTYLMWVPQAWAALGDTQTAIDIVEAAKDNFWWDPVLSCCAMSEITAGDLGAAEQTAQRIVELHSRVRTLTQIATSFIRREQFVDARRIQELIGPYDRVEPFKEIGLAYIEVRDFVTAAEIAEQISDTYAKTELYSSLAKTQYMVGDTTGATASINAFENSVEVDDNDRQFECLTGLRVMVGDYPRAWRAAASIKRGSTRIWAITEIVAGYAATDNQSAALNAISELRRMIEPIEDVEEQISALNGLGRAQRLVGDFGGADMSFEAAVQMAGRLDRSWTTIKQLNIVGIRARAGDLVGAERTAQIIKPVDSSPLFFVANECAVYGDSRGARVLLIRARDETDGLDEGKRSEILAKIVSSQIAYRDVEEALTTAYLVHVPENRCDAFSQVAKALAAPVDNSRASNALKSAVDASFTIINPHILSGLAVAQVELGNFSEARTTMERLRHAMQERERVADHYHFQICYHFAETAFKLGRYGILFSERIGG